MRRKKNEEQTEAQTSPEVQDTKALNQEAEDAVVAAQWEQARRLGIVDLYPESINPEKPQE